MPLPKITLRMDSLGGPLDHPIPMPSGADIERQLRNQYESDPYAQAMVEQITRSMEAERVLNEVSQHLQHRIMSTMLPVRDLPRAIEAMVRSSLPHGVTLTSCSYNELDRTFNIRLLYEITRDYMNISFDMGHIAAFEGAVANLGAAIGYVESIRGQEAVVRLGSTTTGSDPEWVEPTSRPIYPTRFERILSDD